MLAIIGGSGFAKLAGLGNARREVVRTPYGDASCALTHGEFDGHPVVFLARHGYGHTIAPHEINYRANIWALDRVGVTAVVAVATVGGIRADCVAGVLVVPDQIVDYTSGRRHTFFEGVDQPVTHVDFTWPYDDEVRRRLLDAALRCGEAVVDGAVYGSPAKRRDGRTGIENLFVIGTDQGLVGIVGTMLSGVLMANQHALAARSA